MMNQKQEIHLSIIILPPDFGGLPIRKWMYTHG
jgi:hypothetical protein